MKEPQKFYHPNIHNDGRICHQIVTKVSGTVTIKERISAIIELLAVPNPDSPYNRDAAIDFQKEYNEYYKKAIKKFRQVRL